MLSRRRNKDKTPVKESRMESSADRHDTPLRTNTKSTTQLPVCTVTREGVAATATTVDINQNNTTTTTTSPQHLHNMPPIYAAPTVDTLDDDSLFLSRAPLHWGNNHNNNKNTIYNGGRTTTTALRRPEDDDEQSGVMRHHVSFTPTSINSSYSFNNSTYSYHHTAYSPTRTKAKAKAQQQQKQQQIQSSEPAATAGASAAAKQPQPQQQSQTKEVERRQTAVAGAAATKLPTTKRKRKKQQPRDFQHIEDTMKVTIRSVNVAQRSAFAMSKPVSIEEWHMAAERLESKTNKSSASLANAHKKLSPSLQLLNLLHSMQSLNTIRQLNFSPSVGIDSDAFVPWWEDALSSRADGNNNISSSNIANKENNDKLKRRSSSVGGEQRDGRYRSIHPVQATVSTLPAIPPSLSNKKARLPMRTDVGFPNASEGEIKSKEAEINRETEWEEASPRLIVLVTGDDLGTSVQEDDPDPIIPPEHWEWNGGGLQGMPWAGREILRAKELNALHFSRKSSILAKSLTSSTTTTTTNNKSTNNNKPQKDETGNEENESYQSIKQRLLEPNRISVLAPPLDASHSKTLGWRPRPFHDRQPGMEYLLCWPLHVSFDAGDLEPLLCSLALYNLPTSESTTTSSGSLAVYGKISEEFWFPAGDWDGKIDFDPSFLSVPTANGTSDSRTVLKEAELKDAWTKRKQKAIFSYDPLVIKGGKRSLFWVLQVYKVANDDLTAPYLSTKDSMSSHKRNNGVKKLFKGKSPTKQRNGLGQESTVGEQFHAHLFFEKFGTTMMTPLAFGVQSILDKATGNNGEQKTKTTFPKGNVRELNLWETSPWPESQEDFVQRLSKMVSNSKTDFVPEESWQPFGDIGLTTDSSQLHSEISHTSDVDLASLASSVSDRSAPNESTQMTSSSSSDKNSLRSAESKQKSSSSPGRKKKSLKKRIWMSPVKATRSLKSSSQSLQKAVSTTTTRSSINTNAKDEAAKQTNKPVAATASVFTSFLDTDWLETMLKEPTDMEGFKLFDHSQSTVSLNMPKLLCDISGDFAVMLEDRGSGKKRSNLIRTPSHNKPAGYTTASEIREILWLPARPEKQYDVDIPPSFRSLVNLLYLYPRLLRHSPEQPNGSKQKKQDLRTRYTVRVRLVRSSLEVDQTGTIAASQQALEAFHSPSPWTGSPLLDEVYTKLPSNQAPRKQHKDSKSEQPMRDEFKLRLPTILDGTFFLQFTLLELHQDFNLRTVAENSIPLSSSSVRDFAGGSKVATCIPNGVHRVKLGDFRLYIESRLVSSIHVADAAVAAAVRDFSARKESSGALMSIPSSNAALPALFANASGGTLVGHFQLLLYIHLSALLVSGGDNTKQTKETRESMMGTMRSLFEMLRKVKLRLDPGGRRGTLLFRTGTRKRLDTFLKIAIDEFEEHFLDLPKKSAAQRLDEQSSELGSDVDLAEVRTGSSAVEEDENDEEFLDEGAVRHRKDSLRHGIDRRLSRRASVGLGASSGTSLSRVAYGASKTDRMKVEAELYYDVGRFSHLFEDDETIVTSGTSLHNFSDSKNKQEMALRSQQSGSKVWSLDKNKSLDDLYSEHSIKAATAAASRAIEPKTNDSTSTSLDEGFATRVKTVATVMLAPCVGNGKAGSSPRRLSLDCGRSARRRRRDSKANKEKGLGETAIKAPDKGKEKSREMFVFPGSDVEEDDDEARQGSVESRYASFRGRLLKPLVFTAKGSCLDEADSPLLGGRHVYESLLVLWLQVWLEQHNDAKADVPPFDSPATSSILLDFFSHKDILLPLILKSIALRHGSPTSNEHAKAVLDTTHLSVLRQFVEMLACCVMGQALANSHRSAADSKDSCLLTALSSSDMIVDFFQGLFAVLHPEHMRSLVAKYFKTLRDCETDQTKESKNGLLEFEWTQQSIHRVKSSRQLRLRALEKLAVMPSFLALNFPLKFSDRLLSVPTRGIDDSTWKMQYNDTAGDSTSKRHESNDTQRPVSGWLARLLADEACSICALSCEAVVAEAIAHIEHAQIRNSMKEDSQKKLQLERGDLLMFQSLAIHSITSMYELVLRRHAMDRRFQTDTCRGRIAALHAEGLFSHSLQSVRWLARMESTHKVRSIWMLCLVYVLQEAPEILIRDLVRSYCDASDILIHRFIRLLRLASSTFQSFVDQSRHSTFPNEIDESISPWLLQESFNTILNATNIVVEECVTLTESNPYENKKLFTSVLDLFLHILTTPQSPVTHLRAVGGALQALEQFGVAIFLDAVGNTLQHWLRIILSLMNSISLSVRSISVDFVLSLLGSAFDLLGNVDEILLVFVTVLPEVVAREIGLYSVDGHVQKGEDLERLIWPLRRSFADLEDANPLDDDRIDPELSPVLKTFCRASQAVLDGVLIELRLKNDKCIVVGTHVKAPSWATHAFDADEESLVEAANFFLPETGPIQRIRWLRTLKSLHEAKGQWLEAAEAMMACASTISDSLTHLDNVWRPSAFLLWQDSRRSTWLQTVGEDIGHPDRGNAAVVSFSDDFLEPSDLLGTRSGSSSPEKLPKPTTAAMCSILTLFTKEAVKLYLREEGMEELAYIRLENLQRILMGVLSEQSALGLEYRRNARSISIEVRKRQVEKEALLRRVTGTLSGLLVGLLVDEVQEPDVTMDANLQDKIRLPTSSGKVPFYLLVSISGHKPQRFQESTTLPTFLEWGMPCVCRVSAQQVEAARKVSKGDVDVFRKQICMEYGKVLKAALPRETPVNSVEVCIDVASDEADARDPSKTYIDMTLLHNDIELLLNSSLQHLSQLQESKRLFYKKPARQGPPLLSQQESGKLVGLPAMQEATTIVEVTVAHSFPSILSRQRALLTSEFKVSA